MVALASLNPNTLKLPSAPVTPPSACPVALPRARLTERLKDQIVELYQAGGSVRSVSELTGVARSTVLRVLRQRQVQVRPWGVKH
jgi:transposase-like protein